MHNKIDTQKKYYICQYGVFYEGQQLSEYCQSAGHFYYINDVILEKFIVHWHNYKPCLYFRFYKVGKKQKWVLPVDRLGIFFKK